MPPSDRPPGRRDVLSSLPHTRPQRRSARRPALDRAGEAARIARLAGGPASEAPRAKTRSAPSSGAIRATPGAKPTGKASVKASDRLAVKHSVGRPTGKASAKANGKASAKDTVKPSVDRPTGKASTKATVGRPTGKARAKPNVNVKARDGTAKAKATGLSKATPTRSASPPNRRSGASGSGAAEGRQTPQRILTSGGDRPQPRPQRAAPVSISPPSAAEIAGAAVATAGEMAQAGLGLGGRLLRTAVSRLPHP